MLLKRLIVRLSRNKGGIALLSGMAAVLGGVERLMLPKMTAPRKPVPLKILVKRTDYFSIRRTKSDLGYTYWVLQGHGYFASFALFDTWRDAMDEANHRTAAVPARTTATDAEYATLGS